MSFPLLFEKTLKSEIAPVRQTVAQILAFIAESAKLSEEDAWDLRLVFSELLYNAVIHGNGCDASKRITVRVQACPTQVTAAITDEGSGFDHQSLLSCLDAANSAADTDMASILKEDGRGIRLAYALTDTLYFNNRGNEIIFRKRMMDSGG